MSLYVLDSSVAVKWVLKEVGTPKALALRNDIQQQIHEVIAPTCEHSANYAEFVVIVSQTVGKAPMRICGLGGTDFEP